MASSLGDCEMHLFDPTLLPKYDDIKELISTIENQGFVVRPLDITDFKRGYLPLLQHLTSTGEENEEKFIQTFRKMKDEGTYYIIVVIDPTVNKVIATTTLFLEYKFVHSCAIRSRIEDVVVDQGYRGKHLAKILVRIAILLSEKLNSYKLSLDCSDLMKPFYLSLGFVAEEGRDNMLVIRH